jgi:ATP-dependent DNA helicase RecQ
MPAADRFFSFPELQQVIARHWGFRTLRPLQEQAMKAVLADRDSLVVLPTGGGKSLCYQAPAVLRGETTVVISPLISLMKDQVDSLRQCGVAAVQLDSMQTSAERFCCEQDILQGKMRLVFVSPERLVLTDFKQLLQRVNVRTFAIDEAHCISHWGHDFRPEYRQLNRLHEHFPHASIHAYTATATERVRRDIIAQLALKNPEVLVGNFDRPNLTYRVFSRHDLLQQVFEVIERHRGEAGIIYCTRRADVDELAATLQKRGIAARPYHAGMAPEERRATQDAFAAEKCDLVVATVAFGMGIDRSNIRFVLHAAMPKSIEHYQQETGRAGRDGLEAECVLLYSGGDFRTWKGILDRAGSEPGIDAEYIASAALHLNDMDRYCRGAVCRHRALVRYFGQSYQPQTCGACDICLGDAQPVPDAAVVAQKILSCVARVQERFGAGQVIAVLRGENTDSVRKWRHDQLSTYGLLAECSKADLRDWIYQLVAQEALGQEEIRLPNNRTATILKLNAASWEVMHKKRPVRLVQLVRRRPEERPQKSRADTVSWEGVDRDLFEAMRGLRRQLSEARQVQPYMILSDATLRELARVRPSNLERMRWIYGIGEAKLRDLGQRFLDVIEEHCRERRLSRDNPSAAPQPAEPRVNLPRPNPQRELALNLFRQGQRLTEVMRQTGRARSTLVEYLCDYVRQEHPATLRPWIADELFQRISSAARQVGTDRLKPLYVALGESVPYDDIRLVVTYLQTSINGKTHQEQKPSAEAR